MVRLSNGTVKRILREIVNLNDGNILDHQQLTILNERITLMHEKSSRSWRTRQNSLSSYPSSWLRKLRKDLENLLLLGNLVGEGEREEAKLSENLKEGEKAKFSGNLKKESTPTLETPTGGEKSAALGKSCREREEAKFSGTSRRRAHPPQKLQP
ncbi:hypothetical protein V6N13_092639 [Hibiscus sabdariffa]|uniref:Uncharacterized protein n=1 Tax=Hibiscus sabdariffa TaxID=183260 RepID=A0ABR2N8B1_9ROSI